MTGKAILKRVRKGSTILLCVASLTGALSFLAPSARAGSLKPAKADAITTVQPDSALDTGNHTYHPTDLLKTANYVTGSTDNHTVPDGSKFDLVNDTSDTVGFAVFKAALSTKQPFHVDATISIQKSIYGNPFDSFIDGGDALGFILTSATADQLKKNIVKAIGPHLGIDGLPDSFFLGRDLFFNVGKEWDGAPKNGWSRDEGSDELVIRHTDHKGKLYPADYPSEDADRERGGDAHNQAWARAADRDCDPLFGSTTTCISGTSRSMATEQLQLWWDPYGSNGSGLTGGRLYVELFPEQKYGFGDPPVTINVGATLPDSLSLGMIGGTGGKHSNLSISVDKVEGTPARGTAQVAVNYIKKGSDPGSGDEVIGKATILANVGDRLTIMDPGQADRPDRAAPAAASDSFDGSYLYRAPLTLSRLKAFSYMRPDQLPSIIVGNNDTADNVINLYYQGDPQTVYWNYDQAFKGYGPKPEWPAGLAPQPGRTQAKIGVPQLPPPTHGYFYSAVRYNGVNYYVKQPKGDPNKYGVIDEGPFDNIDQALQAAVKAAGNGSGTMDAVSRSAAPQNGQASGQAQDNTFTVLLETDTQEATFIFKWAGGTPGTSTGSLFHATHPPLPGPMTEYGLAGQPVTGQYLPGAPKDFGTVDLTGPFLGYTASVHSPDNADYSVSRAKDANELNSSSQLGWVLTGERGVGVKSADGHTAYAPVKPGHEPHDILQALGQVRPFKEGGSTYTITYSANVLQEKWSFAYADGSDPSDLPGGGQPIEAPPFKQHLTGAALDDLTQVLMDKVGAKGLPFNTHIVGYRYQTDPVGQVYKTFDDLMFAHPSVVPLTAHTAVGITVLVDSAFQPTLPKAGGQGYWWPIVEGSGVGALALVLGLLSVRQWQKRKAGRSRPGTGR